MRKNAVLLVLLVMSVFAQSVGAAALEDRYAHDQQLVLDEVNKYRQSKGLKPLVMNKFMSHEAAIHSQDMASKRMAFGHIDFNKRIKRIYDAIQLCRSGSENVAYFKVGPREVVRRWLTSPGHRRNIEGNFNMTGVGIAHDKRGYIYYTQIFVRTDNPAYTQIAQK
ncbi:CAP domain-containing protein [Legionella taurinensis]|uniref:CAP domain-containing protein n=1 Tax=Legionella taurinensis TaxID=70611 RepID=UPI000E06696D|nr:CAP domain-containing protein [Legionella taurinensis]MDX1837480.1 CAP domain-containing protein [Legionella taurinensis]STY25549.1 putative transporter [Legionella taurinensis]